MSSAEFEKQSERVKTIIKRLSESLDRRKQTRSAWENTWQDCFDYIVPRKGNVTSTQQEGSRRGIEVYDTTAISANALLAGALHGMLTNPTTRFFDIVMNDKALNDADEVKAWLQNSADRMFSVLCNSNFQTEMHEVYLDLGAIGTACMYMGEDEEDLIHFSARPIKEIYPEENNKGLIDKVDRVFEWTPRQIVAEFGEDKLPEYVVKAYKKGCDEKWSVVHSVLPKAEAFDNEGIHEFKSYYWLEKEKLMLAEKGYFEFPYMIPRWTKTSGEIFGRGPGMEMLADIKMVNAMMESTLRGAQKTVDPPLMVASDGVIGQVLLTPGGLTVIDGTVMDGVPIKPLITDARIDFGYQCVEDVRKRIRSGFYVEHFQMREGPQKTATEVMQIAEEQSRFMGPILGRQHFENLRPMIVRLFGTMLRKGKLDEPPSQIRGKKWDVQYTSLIARAQRMSEGQNIARAISVAAPFTNAVPKALDNLNADRAFRYVMEVYGVPQSVMNTNREIEAMREARAKAEQDALEAQKAQEQADVASKVMPGIAQMQQAQAQAQQG